MTRNTSDTGGDSGGILGGLTGADAARHHRRAMASDGGLAQLLVDAPPCTLGAAKTEGGPMANDEHVEIVKQGAKSIREWRKENPDVRFDLSEANLSGANVGHTSFGGVDLTTVQGLQTVGHRGPSTIGVDTLTKSKGTIRDEFLRGCGFTPWQILEAKLYDPALTATEITESQYKIFDARAHGPIYLGGVFITTPFSPAPGLQTGGGGVLQKGIDDEQRNYGPARLAWER